MALSQPQLATVKRTCWMLSLVGGAIPFLLTSLVGLALVAAFPGLSRILTAFMG